MKLSIHFLNSLSRSNSFLSDAVWHSKKNIFLKFSILSSLLLALPFVAFSQTVTVPQQNKVTVKGEVILPAGMDKPTQNLDVVLLKFILSPEGEVTPTGPQGRVKADSNGRFEFLEMEVDFRAAYQLGTRVQGELQSSKVFFMRAGETLVEQNIIIPGISTDVSLLETAQVSLVIESGKGEVMITEVISMSNLEDNKIDSNKQPLLINLPNGWSNFSIVGGQTSANIAHELEGNILKILHIFPKGKTQIIFQYLLPAWFGGLEFSKTFNHPLERIGVFTPVGRLEITSDKLTFLGEQNLQKTNFLTWQALSSSNKHLSFKISNIPGHSYQFLGVTISLVILLFIAVVIFYRMRLLRNQKSNAS